MSKRKRTQLIKTANYFERNLPFMDYPTYLSNGWPIASGVIEGACRHFVKDRCAIVSANLSFSSIYDNPLANWLFFPIYWAPYLVKFMFHGINCLYILCFTF